MMCLNPKFCRGANLPFFGLGPWAISEVLYMFVGVSRVSL